ncbi:hypothetical protein SAMN05421863_107610 [Nitrosomonas communis]|uniref:Uncharacterized protein n=1 Tax=Nitrosomonas communis TaxID=44574 RepID=A0A1I4V5B1_9PROT|nr:hypothetical protein SAMN05421863_107610 [Nitrosomonas communis]
MSSLFIGDAKKLTTRYHENRAWLTYFRSLRAEEKISFRHNKSS